MRTTVTLEPDVETLLRKAVRSSGAPFKQVLNNALRDGLSPRPGPRKAAVFRQRVFDLGLPRLDLRKANSLADELGDEALLAKMRARA